MPKWIIATLIIGFVLWLIAPAQTEAVVKGTLGKVSERISSSSTR